MALRVTPKPVYIYNLALTDPTNAMCINIPTQMQAFELCSGAANSKQAYIFQKRIQFQCSR